jgi:putative endonuclease
MRSERLATRFLRKKGLRIVTRNYTCNLGEIDIVALDHECLVFAEVRSTASTDLQRPTLSVDAAKQKRLTALAIHFMKQYQLLDKAARFDVLAVSWPAGIRRPVIAHYPAAFEPASRFQLFS